MLAPRDRLWAAPDVVCEGALDLLRAAPGDVVIDLGCGDGPLLFAAARRGVRSLGVEIHAERAAALQHTVAARGLQDAICVVTGNALELDVASFSREALPTCCYLYLIARGLRLVLPLLRRLAAAQPTGQLRVVTALYRFDADCEGVSAPVEVRRVVTSAEGAYTPLHLYVITSVGGAAADAAAAACGESRG